MFNLFSASCSVTCLQWARKYPPLSSELAHVNTPTLMLFFFVCSFIYSFVLLFVCLFIVFVYLFVFLIYVCVCWYLECYPTTPVWLIHFVQGRSVEHIPKMAQCSSVHAKASNSSHDLPIHCTSLGEPCKCDPSPLLLYLLQIVSYTCITQWVPASRDIAPSVLVMSDGAYWTLISGRMVCDLDQTVHLASYHAHFLIPLANWGRELAWSTTHVCSLISMLIFLLMCGRKNLGMRLGVVSVLVMLVSLSCTLSPDQQWFVYSTWSPYGESSLLS